MNITRKKIDKMRYRFHAAVNKSRFLFSKKAFSGVISLVLIICALAWLQQKGFFPIQFARAVGSTYYVDQNNPACSDGGPGSQSQPFCTVKQTQVVAQPGDTFNVADGRYGDVFKINVSGTQEAPISYVAQGDNVILGAFTDLDDAQFAPVDGYPNVYRMEISADVYTHFNAVHQTHYSPIEIVVPDTDTAFSMREEDGPIPFAETADTLGDVRDYEGSALVQQYFSQYFLYVHPYGNRVPSQANTDLVASVHGETLGDELYIYDNVSYVNFDGFKIWYGNGSVFQVHGSNITLRNMNFTTRVTIHGDNNTLENVTSAHNIVRMYPSNTWLDDTDFLGQGFNLQGTNNTYRDLASFHNTINLYTTGGVDLEGGDIHGAIQSCVGYWYATWSNFRSAALYNCGRYVISGIHSATTYENLTLDSGPIFHDWWAGGANLEINYTNDIFNGCAIDVETDGMTSCDWEDSTSIKNSIFLCDNPSLIQIPHCVTPGTVVNYSSLQDYQANCGARCMQFENVSFITSNLTSVIREGGQAQNDGAWDAHISGPNSAAKDSGSATAQSQIDYEGDARPLGGGYDIGADEFINHAPVLTPIGNKTATEGQPYTFTISATDPDDETLVFQQPDGVATDDLTVTDNHDNTATVTWLTTTGSREFTFSVEDGEGVGDSETITIDTEDLTPPSPINDLRIVQQ